jgi:hypothetical protein
VDASSRVCTEQTDETQRLFNDPDVSTSVDVRAGTLLQEATEDHTAVQYW